MNFVERVAKLYKFVNVAGGKIESRKKFHKLVYLLQLAGEDFGQDFVFHNYGVFSPSLANDLDLAKTMEILGEEQVGDAGYTIEIKDVPKREIPSSIRLSNKSCDLLRQLSPLEPRLLETLSTIVYLADNYYSGTSLKAKLKDLKPGLTRFYSEAYRLARQHFGIQV